MLSYPEAGDYGDYFFKFHRARSLLLILKKDCEAILLLQTYELEIESIWDLEHMQYMNKRYAIRSELFRHRYTYME